MQDFYVISDNNRLYLFTHENGKYSQQFVNGEASVRYTRQNLKETVRNLKTYLADEYNVESEKEFCFYIIQDMNETLTESIMLEFLDEEAKNEKYLNELKRKYIIYIGPLIKNALKKYSAQTNAMIDEYGVNFCGAWYFYDRQNVLRRASFSLTAYTLSMTEVLNCIQ